MDAVTLTPNLGKLCPGQDVVLTCSTPTSNYGGYVIDWFYNRILLDTRGFHQSDPISTTRDVIVSGFMFSLELTSSMPEFASTLSFRADAAMNGQNVTCRLLHLYDGGSYFDGHEATKTLQIGQQ